MNFPFDAILHPAGRSVSTICTLDQRWCKGSHQNPCRPERTDVSIIIRINGRLGVDAIQNQWSPTTLRLFRNCPYPSANKFSSKIQTDLQQCEVASRLSYLGVSAPVQAMVAPLRMSKLDRALHESWLPYCLRPQGSRSCFSISAPCIDCNVTILYIDVS